MPRAANSGPARPDRPADPPAGDSARRHLAIRHNGAVDNARWINPHQPQTLSAAVILCYVQAVFMLLSIGALGPLGFVILVGLAGGGFGIANEKKWGYVLAVGAAVLQVALFVAYGGLGYLGYFQVLVGFAFDVLLVVLLLHPMSRSYQRIWFK